MTLDEYYDAAVLLTKQSVSRATGMVTAAFLGDLLRRSHPETSWKTFGKRSLLELLQEMEHLGKLRLATTEKGALAVTLADQVAVVPQSAQVERFNPLRKSVWEAFVVATPRGRRFMHRESGAIRLGLEVAPTPADDWVEISPIGNELQRTWALEFLQSVDDRDAGQLEASTFETDWSAPGFARALRDINAATGQKWNTLRSAKVSGLVKEWLTHNALPTELVFQPVRSPVMPTKPSTPSPLVGVRPDDVRQVILAALSALPTERLLELPIPAGVMLAAVANAKAN